MNARPDVNEVPVPVRKYIDRVPEGNIEDILEELGREVRTLLQGLTEEQAEYRYAEGKWSIKGVIGHLIDNERVSAYRLLRIARADAKELPGYDEGIFAAHAPYDNYSRDQLVTEHGLVRQSTLAMLRSLPSEAWLRQGEFAGHPLSARAVAYFIAGHEDHHLNVIKERYVNR